VASDFGLEVRVEGRMTLLAVSGELDRASTPWLEEELKRANASESVFVVVDLRAVEFVDASGLGVLLDARRRAQRSAQSFVLVGGGEHLRPLLTLAGITDTFTEVATPEELMERTEHGTGE
jgi:anti-sigma B factor antagonist